ncbi:MAG: hypothetical protein RJA44_1653 [Pseudomonadota bacterium]|jgi:general secretion pathway protein M
MNRASSFSGLRQQFEPLRRQLEARWRALAPRERNGLRVALLAVLVLLVWLLGIQPALRTLDRVPQQRAELDRQWEQMQRLAAETQELRQLPPVSSAQAETALRSATGRLGEGARLNIQGERVTVTLQNIEAGALLGWLGELRSAARARVVEATLDRKGSGYSGTIVLNLGRPA